MEMVTIFDTQVFFPRGGSELTCKNGPIPGLCAEKTVMIGISEHDILVEPKLHFHVHLDLPWLHVIKMRRMVVGTQ
jgi:hypothetical protein